MRSTLDELASEIGELRSLVASISPLAGHQDSVVRRYLAVRRRFDYAAFMVALYASYEKFLENLVGGYAGLIARRAQYSALPRKLAKKHLTKSAEMLTRERLGEGRYVGVQEVDVVKNLYDCLTGNMPYSLNHLAVVAHDRNLWYDEINRLFNSVGIEQICDIVRRVDAILEWHTKVNVLTEPLQGGVPAVTIRTRLNDVVERRNQVAHRGGNPQELLGPVEMVSGLDFIEALCRSIFSVVVAKYLRDNHVASGAALALRRREGPFQSGHIVVVDPPARSLRVGQPVFVVDVPGARWGRILTLKSNDKSVLAVNQEDAVAGVGIELDFKFPKNSILYALEVDDDAVWRAEEQPF